MYDKHSINKINQIKSNQISIDVKCIDNITTNTYTIYAERQKEKNKTKF